MTKLNLSILDQLFFNHLAKEETPADRASSIDVYLSSVGATWDDVLDAIVLEKKQVLA